MWETCWKLYCDEYCATPLSHVAIFDRQASERGVVGWEIPPSIPVVGMAHRTCPCFTLENHSVESGDHKDDD